MPLRPNPRAEITAGDPALIDGRGPTVVVEYEAEYSGTLHLWTRSDLDLFLRVEDPMTGGVVGEDDDSGGGKTPHVELTVEAGDAFAVLVAAGPEGPGGPATLHLAAAPEDATVGEAVRAATERLRRARTLRAADDLEGARGLVAEGGALLRDVPGVRWSERAFEALDQLADLAHQLGDFPTGLLARSVSTAHLERTRPPDHADVLAARLNLAVEVKLSGDLDRARELYASVEAGFARTLHSDHRNVLGTRMNRAIVAEEMGDLREARELHESVLAGFSRTLPADHTDLLRARSNLAGTLRELGDLQGALELFESVLQTYERTLPSDHVELPRARANLGAVLFEAGDLAGARAYLEAGLAGYERILPAGNEELLLGRTNLATVLFEAGDLAVARDLFETILRESALPPDHPGSLGLRMNLAVTLDELGDVAAARDLLESVVSDSERELPAGHPDLLTARMHLAASLSRAGELAAAGELFGSVLAGYEAALPPDHPAVLRARANLAGVLYATGDHEAVRGLVAVQVAGMRSRVTGALALAPRQASAVALAGGAALAELLFLTRSGPPGLRRSVFELQETMRMVSAEAARALRSSEVEGVEALLREGARVRAILNDLAGAGERDGAELSRLMRERDRLEREASKRLAHGGVAVQPIDVGRVAEALAADAAVVAYRRIARLGEERLLAHVLTKDGALERVDLGPAHELEALVRAWSPTLGAAPLRGVTLEHPEARGDGREAGEALRARLLDPLLARVDEGTRRLHVCADDLVFLVPLDALPLGKGRVGDRFRIVQEVSLARLQREADAPPAVPPSLLLVGGVDYGGARAAVDDPPARGSRAAPGGFAPLPGAGAEVEALRERFERSLEGAAELLSGRGATREALRERIAGKRYVHVATHGWFAPETIKSTLDEEARGPTRPRTGLGERITGMAPMLLCGLALAGANDPPDPLGRRSGLLTAEELCSLDLSACDLAVLSACETNVGIRRAGQGIQSLQAALYAAGARSSITSLWKVDDVATKRLMEVFYTNLWTREMPRAEALWEAKRVLREEGAQVRDWAGWVLTGDPN